tara:strand:- start:69 stop:395 length:327 start_codon:yes stop_codon:yes gene_type:complete
MKLELLDYLVCPDCKSDFSCQVLNKDNGAIVEGTLSCNNCGIEFPIKKGILRILPAKHNWMNVYDKLVVPIANYYSRDEFEKWFKDSKLNDIQLNMVNRISWGGRGTK